jgi:Cof subfamily protein (haloacid dehalogenase superfamily)
VSYPDIKLIAIDLDGTLLDDNKQITEETIRTVARVKQQGVLVTIASGRPFCSILPYARRLGVTAPLIAQSGAYASDLSEKKIYLNQTLDPVKGREIIKVLEEHDYYLKVYCKNMFYVQEPTEETLAFSRVYGVSYQAVGKYNLSKLNEPITRIMIFDCPARIRQAEELIRPWNEAFSYARDTERGLEIVKQSVNKGNALRLICKQLKINLTNVMAIGNEGNDLEMIREAGFGIAVENACAELKNCAQATTKSNNEYGVEYALKKYILRE